MTFEFKFPPSMYNETKSPYPITFFPFNYPYYFEYLSETGIPIQYDGNALFKLPKTIPNPHKEIFKIINNL